MPSETNFNFDYTYLNLPEEFYQLVAPEQFPAPKFTLFNTKLANELQLSENTEDYLHLISNKEDRSGQFFAQAYAGHQFGHFNRLGDGRAIMLGEHIVGEKQRFDLQLKGSGKTKFSRGGDGKATLKSMLREYLMSEAMHHLGVASSRTLSLLQTGEPVYRETVHEGAAIIRVMKSHIRVGTFEYATHLVSKEATQALLDYSINRLYPDIAQTQNKPIALLEKVMHQQIDLVAEWMKLGFIHGVMNTDNIAISAETFDYGPCAFMNTYDPQTVFSSIDRNGRYAYGNQPSILKWNLVRLAESLLPLIDEDKDASVETALTSINKFDALWNQTYYGKMLLKLGIVKNDRMYYPLVDEFLQLLKEHQLDFTNSFAALVEEGISFDESFNESENFIAWQKKWKQAIAEISSVEEAKQLMKANNPQIIPRNHLVEQALDNAVEGSFDLFDELLEELKTPFDYKDRSAKFTLPPKPQFDKNYQTFCGT